MTENHKNQTILSIVKSPNTSILSINRIIMKMTMLCHYIVQITTSPPERGYRYMYMMVRVMKVYDITRLAILRVSTAG